MRKIIALTALIVTTLASYGQVKDADSAVPKEQRRNT